MNLNSRGATLIEVLTVLALSSVIGVLMVQILVNNSLLVSSQTAAVSQGLSLNQANSLISNDIKLAKALQSSKVVSGSTYNTATASVILSLPSILSSGDNSETYLDSVVISRDATKSNILRRWVIKDATQSTRKSENMVLSNALSSITFTYYDVNGILITNPANFIQAAKITYTINVITNLGGNNNKKDTVSNTISLRNI